MKMTECWRLWHFS